LDGRGPLEAGGVERAHERRRQQQVGERARVAAHVVGAVALRAGRGCGGGSIIRCCCCGGSIIRALLHLVWRCAYACMWEWHAAREQPGAACTTTPRRCSHALPDSVVHWWLSELGIALVTVLIGALCQLVQ
jgi:hypothetical protein